MADTGLTRSVVADILGFQSTQAEQEAAARGTGYSIQGYNAEAGAYGTGAQLANQNSLLAGLAGDIQAIQAKRAVTKSIGGTRADIAGAGFKEAGSAIDILRNSYQQGYLTDQLIRTQTAMTQGGYLEEAAAATGEQSAAQFASQAAAELAAAQSASASTAKANAASETSALLSYLKSTGATAETNLVTSVLSGDTNGALSSIAPVGGPSSNLSKIANKYMIGAGGRGQ